MVAHYAGKRTDATCTRFLFRLFARLRVPRPTARISITTDGNPQHLVAIAKRCWKSCIDYVRVVKHRKGNRLVAVVWERIFGNPAITSSLISLAERYNNEIRQRISRCVRKTASFSKTIVAHTRAMDLFQFVSNFIDVKGGTTPAMREGITDHVWTWREFLTYHFQL